MTSSLRIAFNTVATYTHSLLAVGLGLFSSRWVLSGLGHSDYGLFNVVGSIIIFVTFFNSVMAGSVARHYAFSIGHNDSAEVNRWFNLALRLHIILAIVLVFSGWYIGQYVIENTLNVPESRLFACLWVFRISLISAFFSMLSIPFVAMFRAKQRIVDLAVSNILYSLMTFVMAWYLTRVTGDRLLFYAGGMVSIVVFFHCGQILWGTVAFCECRIHHQRLDKHRLKEIFSFASWIMIAHIGGLLRNQGSAIMLNIYFGTTVNAAYGVANQISSQTNQLAASMIGAFSPEITSTEGRGDRMRMLSLSRRASKFGTILVLLFSIPLMIEMDYVLNLWLLKPPLHAAMFSRLILMSFIIDRFSVGCMLAVIAHGKIAAYQATVGTCMVLTLPLAWIFIKLGAPPTFVGVAFVITMIGITVGRVFWMRRLFGVPINQWIRTIVLPCGVVGLAATFAVLIPYLLLPTSFIRLVSVTGTGILVSLLTTWFFAFDDSEREFFLQNMRLVMRKLIVITRIGGKYDI